MQKFQVVPEQRSSAEKPHQNSPINILRLPRLMQKIGMSRSKTYDLVKRQKFPAPISLGDGRSVGWVESEVENWLVEQIQNSRAVLKGGA